MRPARKTTTRAMERSARKPSKRSAPVAAAGSGSPTPAATVAHVLLVGDENVGITSIMERQAFDHKAEGDWGLGIESYEENVRIDGRAVRLLLFEIAAPTAFEPLKKDFHARPTSVVLVYDASQRKTLEYALSAYEKLRSSLGATPLVLCANKVDVTPRTIGPIEGTRIATSLGGAYVETSVVERRNIETLLHVAGAVALGKPPVNVR